MVDRFTVYPGVTYHSGQPHQNIKGEYVRFSDYKALQKELAERTAERDEYREIAHDRTKTWTVAESRADTLARRVEGLAKPITMQDVRLAVGEGKLRPVDVLNGANAELRRRAALKQKDGGNG